MNNSPLVSVVITTYNRANDLIYAIESVKKQTYENIELLVIDDGSSDNTRGVVKKYADFVRYYYKKNGGVASSKNYGVKMAKGELVAFLDSDDLWLPEKLTKQVKLLNEVRDCGAIITEFEVVDEQSKHLFFSKIKKSIPVNGFILHYILRNPHVGIGSNLLVKKEVFEVVGYMDEKLVTAQDQEWMFKLCSRFSVAVVDEVLVMIKRSTKSNKRLFSGNSLIAIKRLEEFNPDFFKNNIGLFQGAYSCVHMRYGTDLMYNRYLKEARKQFFNSLNYKITIKCILLLMKSYIIQVVSYVSQKYKDKGSFQKN